MDNFTKMTNTSMQLSFQFYGPYYQNFAYFSFIWHILHGKQSDTQHAKPTASKDLKPTDGSRI